MSTATALSACSLFTNLDNLASDASTALDASDASTDASPSDVVSDQALTFCQTVDGAAFCDDFTEQSEGMGIFVPPWTKEFLNNGSLTQAVVDGGDWLSASVGAGDASSYAYLRRTLGVSGSLTHYAFDLQIVVPGGVTGVNASLVEVPTDASDIQAGFVYLAVTGTNATLFEQHVYVDGSIGTLAGMPFLAPPPGSPVHVDIIVDTAAQTASLALDGGTPSAFNIPGFFVAGTPAIRAGITHENPLTNQFQLMVTNVVVWVE